MILTGILVLAIVILTLSAYPHLREARFASLLQKAARDQEFHSVEIYARQLLEMDPDHPQALRAMVEISNLAPGTAYRLYWVERLAEAMPTEPHICLLITELVQMRDYSRALETVHAHSGRFSSTARFQLARGLVFLLHDQREQALEAFQTARELDPGNRETALNILKLQLTSPDPAEQAQAEAALENWPPGSDYYGESLIARLDYHLLQHRPEAAQQVARRILDEDSNAFEDHLRAFRYLNTHSSKTITEQDKKSLEASASENPEKAALWLDFLQSTAPPVKVESWLHSVPPDIRQSPPVVLKAVDFFLKQNQAGKALELVGTFTSETVPELKPFLTLKINSLGTSSYRLSLEKYLFEQSGNLPGILRLLGVCRRMEWHYEVEEILWSLAEIASGQLAPLRALHRHYLRERNTIGLLRVAARIYQQYPDDFVAANNLAYLQMLTGRNTRNAIQLAQKSFEAYRADPAARTTYALALLMEGSPGQAILLLDPMLDQSSVIDSTLLIRALAAAMAGDDLTCRKLLQRISINRLFTEEAQWLESLEEGMIPGEFGSLLTHD